MSDMTDEMIEAAKQLQKAALRYRELYNSYTGKDEPVVWVRHDETGEAVFIADSFNSDFMIAELNNFQPTNTAGKSR